MIQWIKKLFAKKEKVEGLSSLRPISRVGEMVYFVGARFKDVKKTFDTSEITGVWFESMKRALMPSCQLALSSPKVQNLIILKERIDPKIAVLFEQNENLRELSLAQCSCKNAQTLLNQISTIKNLQSLHLSALVSTDKVQSYNFEPIFYNPNLSKFDMYKMQMFNVANFAHHPMLKDVRLSLVLCKNCENVGRALASLPRLNSLDISLNADDFVDSVARSLPDMHMSHLDINNVKLTENVFRGFEQNASLTELNVVRCSYEKDPAQMWNDFAARTQNKNLLQVNGVEVETMLGDLLKENNEKAERICNALVQGKPVSPIELKARTNAVLEKAQAGNIMHYDIIVDALATQTKQDWAGLCYRINLMSVPALRAYEKAYMALEHGAFQTKADFLKTEPFTGSSYIQYFAQNNLLEMALGSEKWALPEFRSELQSIVQTIQRTSLINRRLVRLNRVLSQYVVRQSRHTLNQRIFQNNSRTY